MADRGASSAKDAPEIFTKSPVNAAVGALLKALRTDAGEDTQAVARAFDLSSAYVRALEAGLRVVPGYTAVALVEHFGMTWSAATAIVAVANFMDLARENDQYKQVKLIALAGRAREIRPEFCEFFDGIAEAIAANDRPGSPEWTARATHLSEVLERCANRVGDEKNRHALSSPATLNPIFEDLAELFMDRLASFPPYANTPAILRWEKKNNHRILRLCGYVSDGETLIKSPSDFDWKFLRKDVSPNVRVLVPSRLDLEMRRIEKGFLAALAKALRAGSERVESVKAELSHRVQVRSAGELQPACSRALRFDFSTRSKAAARTSAKSQMDFPNAWIYELQPESHDANSPRCVGFLMDKDAAEGFAVAMSREHVAEWLSIFQKIWSDDRSRQPASRTTRRIRT